MRASIGDKLHIHTNHVGVPDQHGRIIEIRGIDGAPPYLVRFPDGHTRLIFPGPDAVVDVAGPQREAPARAAEYSRQVHARIGR